MSENRAKKASKQVVPIKTNLLRAELVRFDVNQKDLAKLMGVHEATINAKFNGRRDFTVQEVVALANAFGWNLNTIAEIFMPNLIIPEDMVVK